MIIGVMSLKDIRFLLENSIMVIVRAHFRNTRSGKSPRELTTFLVGILLLFLMSTGCLGDPAGVDFVSGSDTQLQDTTNLDAYHAPDGAGPDVTGTDVTGIDVTGDAHTSNDVEEVDSSLADTSPADTQDLDTQDLDMQTFDTSDGDIIDEDARDEDIGDADVSQDAESDAVDDADIVIPLFCLDGILNGDETDIDCGGSECPPCEVGQFCSDDNDCAESIYYDFGPCMPNNSNVCDINGTQTRGVTHYSCNQNAEGKKMCTEHNTSELHSCQLDRENLSCGDDVCGDWSECSNETNICSETGTRARTCYSRICQSGSCEQVVTDIETEDCTRNTEGDACKAAGNDACSLYSCAQGTCKGTARCTGTTQSCGCESCHRCPPSGWFVAESNVPCCDENGQTCQCDKEEYREYACESHACQFTVTNTRFVSHKDCSTCADETYIGDCMVDSDANGCEGTQQTTTHTRRCSEETKNCEQTETTVTSTECTMPDGSYCEYCPTNGSICVESSCEDGTCIELNTSECVQGLQCRSSDDCFGGTCEGITCFCGNAQ